jgi:hypothetical protein
MKENTITSLWTAELVRQITDSRLDSSPYPQPALEWLVEGHETIRRRGEEIAAAVGFVFADRAALQQLGFKDPPAESIIDAAMSGLSDSSR